MNSFPGRFLWLIILLVVWSIVWKGLALWASARRGQKWWFVVFLVLNTAGALEILYLLVLYPQRPPAQPLPKA